VDTFIASGNVFLEADEVDLQTLEGRIESHMTAALGFQVAVFLRTLPELEQIAGCRPFSPAEFSQAAAFNVAFLKTAADQSGVSRLMALQNDLDSFAVVGREIYWLCRVRQSKSQFSNAVLEKVLGQPSTLRQVSTVAKLLEKYRG
jgi:uncharacterized protein (DUF1697 family)